MTPRREILRLMLGGFGVLASCRTGPADRRSRHAATQSADRLKRDFERRFLRDYRRTSARAYSEEGIPVFLVGENRVEGERPGTTTFPGDPWMAALAADVRRAADVLSKAGLGAGEGDVGKLVEVLAERDFGTLREGARP